MWRKKQAQGSGRYRKGGIRSRNVLSEGWWRRVHGGAEMDGAGGGAGGELGGGRPHCGDKERVGRECEGGTLWVRG